MEWLYSPLKNKNNMGKFKVVIVDDDKFSLDALSAALERDERFEPVGVARSGKSGLKLVEKTMPDLLFLDVELPDTTGMALLREMRDELLTWPMRVVFYTAYDKYMIQAIREAAFDYLLKPFDEQELQEILNRFVEQAEAALPANRPTATEPRQGQTFMVFTPTNDMRALRTSEIGFFRYSSERKLWEAVISGQPPIALRRGTTAEQITAYAPCFVQIHQSYIINLDYLMIIKEYKCLLYPPFDQVNELLVSRKYKKELQDKFCL